MPHLVIDIGTSSIRCCIVDANAALTHELRVPFLPSTPFPGLVEFDAKAMAGAVIEAAEATLRTAGPVSGIGIATQRASTVVWDASTGEPVAMGLGWQDLRTIGTCLELKPKGFNVPPNASATKIAHLLDLVDADRSKANLRFGTIDSWLIWNLSDRQSHVTDPSNAATTSLAEAHGASIRWSEPILAELNIASTMLPTIVDSIGECARATVLRGTPPITAIFGDQQASLFGQGCITAGQAKATFGTGGMVDVVRGYGDPPILQRNAGGTIPIAVRQTDGAVLWGVESVMLSAGSCVEWLRDDMQIISTAKESATIAASCNDTDGVVFVPAMLGLATPHWDYGARSTLLGITRGTTRAQIVRAVLEGVANRGADLLEAAQTDAGITVESLRVDGGMSANSVFVQALADACNRPIELSPVLEATALGAGLGAAVGTGELTLEDVARTWRPKTVVEPTARAAEGRQRWGEAIARSKNWFPELSALDF